MCLRLQYVVKKSFELKSSRRERGLDFREAEDLGKQTLLSCADMEMWVTHLDAVRNRGKADASKVAARCN